MLVSCCNGVFQWRQWICTNCAVTFRYGLTQYVTSDTPYDQRPPKYMSTLHAIGAAKLFQLNICILSYSVQRRTGHQYYIYCYSPEYNPMIDPSAMTQDKTKNTLFLYQDDDVPHFQVIFNKR